MSSSAVRKVREISFLSLSPMCLLLPFAESVGLSEQVSTISTHCKPLRIGGARRPSSVIRMEFSRAVADVDDALWCRRREPGVINSTTIRRETMAQHDCLDAAIRRAGGSSRARLLGRGGGKGRA